MNRVLEMLWEPDDPARVLAERFGFDSAPAAARWVTGTLDAHWGVRADSCERIVMSGGNALAWVGTSSGRLLAKWSVVPARFARLAEVARLTGWLDQRGVPVSALVPARDGRRQLEIDGVSLGVQRVVPGELLDVTDPVQVRAAGAALAHLQDALAVYPDADRFPALAGELLTPRVSGLRAPHLRAAALDRLRGLIDDAPADRLPQQLVHYDVRSANVLWAGGRVAAFLDFEEAQHDHRLAELARAAILLGTRYHNWGPVPAAVRAEFLAGYQDVCPLTPDEVHWLDILLLWQALAMVPPGDDPTGWAAAALS